MSVNLRPDEISGIIKNQIKDEATFVASDDSIGDNHAPYADGIRPAIWVQF